MQKNTDKKIKFEKGEIKKQISIAFTKDEIEFMKYAYIKTFFKRCRVCQKANTRRNGIP